MSSAFSRRSLLTALGAAPLAAQAKNGLKVSLAEWSIHKAIQGGRLTNLDFPRIARESNCDGLEFVNTLWSSPTQGYLNRLKRLMREQNVTGVLIMVDDEGMMGHSDKAMRLKAADNHRKWVDAAAELGCHSIRTNMYPDKQPVTAADVDAFLSHCAESFNRLLDYSQGPNINVIIENHGGISSNPDVVVSLMKKVNRPNFGTLPDFGNFPAAVDKYEAVRKLMAFAKGASYKCYFEGPNSTEDRYDIAKMINVVLGSGYRGFFGIEYEGNKLDEIEGIKRARAVLDQLVDSGAIRL